MIWTVICIVFPWVCKMENKIFLNALLDYYECLLTDHQKEICEAYYREDASLNEIAASFGTSRAAVYDTVMRCRHELEEYEEKLHLLAMDKKRNALYDQMERIADPEMKELIAACRKVEEDI